MGSCSDTNMVSSVRPFLEQHGTLSCILSGSSRMSASAKKTILVAEDNANDIFLLKSAFEDAETDVGIQFVKDGKLLVEYLEEKPLSAEHPLPELLLLDLNMPKMDGFEVLRWI